MCGIFRVGEIDPESVTAEKRRLRCARRPDERELIKALLASRRWSESAAETLEPQRVRPICWKQHDSRICGTNSTTFSNKRKM